MAVPRFAPGMPGSLREIVAVARGDFDAAFFGVDEVGRPLKDVADHVVVMVVSGQLGRPFGSVGGRSETSFAIHCITFVRDTKLL